MVIAQRARGARGSELSHSTSPQLLGAELGEHEAQLRGSSDAARPHGGRLWQDSRSLPVSFGQAPMLIAELPGAAFNAGARGQSTRRGRNWLI